jgi:DNA segregation ATPase FtsK/SpoIIIE-like protein
MDIQEDRNESTDSVLEIIDEDELPFTQIKNVTLRDPRLDLESRGLLVWLLSHSSGYKLSRASVQRQLSIGNDRMSRLIHKLKAADYLSIVPVREKGVVATWKWCIKKLSATNPLLSLIPENQKSGFGYSGHQNT